MIGLALALLTAISSADKAADRAVDAIDSSGQLAVAQRGWRTAWLAGLGGLPDRTPLNAVVVATVPCDGFVVQNIRYESLPGVYVTAHLALPNSPKFKPPYPVVMMMAGHSDNALLASRYAAHFAMMARAGMAVFSIDPISQGERRQSEKRFDYTDNCSTEHCRLGARGWLIGWNFARFLIWDGIRALDYLETRKEIDMGRVGVCGTSGGGTQSAYLQAWDPRIKAAFPNCFISSIREVFAERGCHDAEQFFFGQLKAGVNHAAIMSMSLPKMSLATGSRWQDYFPHKGAESTFAVVSNLSVRIGAPIPWHFHCAGPHGLPLPTRAAQTDWLSMKLGVVGGAVAQCSPLESYWQLSKGDHSGLNDPASSAPLPFPEDRMFVTPTHQVRDLPGFKSIFTLIAERALELKKRRRRLSREELRATVRKRAGIRPLAELKRLKDWRAELKPFDHKFDWWYLHGPWGFKRENEAAMLATLGRSVIGRDAERMILEAAGKPAKTALKAKGFDCIAAAHAYAAEPQLFSGVELEDLPPSWTEMVTRPNPADDSYATGVWGALIDYDWPDLLPRL